MSELIDAFEDAGLDRETVAFLAEALANAEQEDWGAVLEPFLPPERALAVLASCPGVLERTAAALAKEAEAAAEEAAKPPPNADSPLLDAFILGLCHAGAEPAGFLAEELPGLLPYLSHRGLARCARLCRRAGELVALDCVWQPRMRGLCARWGLECTAEGPWRERYFTALRPRCDGIYVGECGYMHHIRPGASMDAKLYNKRFLWVDYRRYVRLLPPDPLDGACFALVLRDVCPFKAAMEALLTVDPRTHVNAEEVERLAPEHRSLALRTQATQAQLRARVAAGTYVREGSRVEISFSSVGSHYRLVLGLSHGVDQHFCGRLEWLEYSMVDRNAELVPFNLGRSTYGGGEPADHERDHFPAMLVRPCRKLEHLA